MEWLESALQEQYQLVRLIKDTEDKQIKVLRHTELGKDILYRRFRGDVAVYSQLVYLSHPNLPRVFQASQSGDVAVVLEEFIDGVSIFEVLESGLYVEEGVRKVVSGLCNALTCLHSRSIIHRDIKPENVIVDNSGTVKLIDYDAAKIYKPHQSEDTKVQGTMGYAAPEQLGVSQSDRRADIYAVGILMNVMLTGHHPSQGVYKGKLARQIKKCTNIEPGKRYASAEELKRSL